MMMEKGKSEEAFICAKGADSGPESECVSICEPKWTVSFTFDFSSSPGSVRTTHGWTDGLRT